MNSQQAASLLHQSAKLCPAPHLALAPASHALLYRNNLHPRLAAQSQPAVHPKSTPRPAPSPAMLLPTSPLKSPSRMPTPTCTCQTRPRGPSSSWAADSWAQRSSPPARYTQQAHWSTCRRSNQQQQHWRQSPHQLACIQPATLASRQQRYPT